MIKFLLLLLVIMISGCGVEREKSEDKNLQTQDISKQQVILALGDSLTAGYNLDIKDAFPAQLEEILKVNGYNYKLINAGVSGDTSANLLSRIGLYDEITADIILLGIGANDGLRRQSIEDMKKNIEKTIDELKIMYPEGKIVLEGMQMPLNLGSDYSNDFKKVFSDIADEYELAFYPFLLTDVATKKELNLNDGIHPNKQGYTIIANNLYDFLRKEGLLEK